jgi:hypothetical protein
MSEPSDELEVVFEPDRVGWYRFNTLFNAGYPLELARRLADDSSVDLHRAVELVVDRGCDPGLAARILL